MEDAGVNEGLLFEAASMMLRVKGKYKQSPKVFPPELFRMYDLSWFVDDIGVFGKVMHSSDAAVQKVTEHVVICIGSEVVFRANRFSLRISSRDQLSFESTQLQIEVFQKGRWVQVVLSQFLHSDIINDGKMD